MVAEADPGPWRLAMTEYSDRFAIYKVDDDSGPWYLDYPDRFHEHSAGEHWDTFDEAVAAFIKASEARCPTCDRGTVEDRPWGWECTNCQSYDVAQGCVR